MRLRITHRTEYRSDLATPYALQRLRLVPVTTPTQTVRSWTLTIEGAREEVRFSDQFGNDNRLIGIEGEPHDIAIEAVGEVDTISKAGVTGPHRGFAPLWLFRRETPLTQTDAIVEALAAGVPAGPNVGRLHELMAAVHGRIADSTATVVAPSSLSQTQDGVAQQQTAATMPSAESSASTVNTSLIVDHTHMFIAAARLLGFPSRFVGGYLMVDGVAEHAAVHAWAEAHVEPLGWIGFDVAHLICPDENYVRVASGCDHRDTMPFSGFPLGQAAESLAVRITVEQ